MIKNIIDKYGAETLLKEFVLPVMLSFVLSSAVFYAYGAEFLSLWTLGQFIIMVAFTRFFVFIKKHRYIGGALYVIVCIFCFYLFLRFALGRDWGEGFSVWFLSGGSETDTRPEYYMTLLVSFTPFLISVVYYFSAVLYRISFLMLASLIPCALYVKILSDMSNMYLVLISAMNILIYAVNNREMNIGRFERSRIAGAAAAGAVVVITMLLASLIPKQGEAKYYDLFENYFMNAGIGGSGDGFNLLSDRSGNAGDFRSTDNTPLYDIYSDELLYLRRQSFDMYDPSQHNWYALGKYSTPDPKNYTELFGRQKILNYDDMLAAIKKGCSLEPSLAQKYHLSDKLLSLDSAREEAANVSIVSLTGNTNYLIAPVRAYRLKEKTDGDRVFADVGSTLHKQLTSGSSMIYGAPTYTFSYYREFSSRNRWILSGGTDFTDEECAKFYTELYNLLKDAGESDMCLTVRAFAEDYLAAMEYKEDTAATAYVVPAELANLAKEITADCTYDWQKADALQMFFHSGEFIYDLDYIAPADNNTSTFFVFSSKRGTCSDFATAYTLMARSVGLTVRYTEGFSPDFTSDRNVFRVRASGSHAYPEVYIQNMGWIVFEPTVAAMYNTETVDLPQNNAAVNNFTIDTELIRNIILFVLISAALISAAVLTVPVIREIKDRIVISGGGIPAFVVMMRKMKKRLAKRCRRDVYSMTAEEFAREAESCGGDISGFAQLYGKVCFGGYTPGAEEFSGAKNIYEAFMKLKLGRR